MPELIQRALHVNLATGYYRVVRITDENIIGPVDYGFREYTRQGAMVMGGGPFMGSILSGSNRLVVTGPSPAWGGFYVSTMGGAALVFDNLGINYLVLEDRSPTPCVLSLRREGGEEIEVELRPVDVKSVWAGGGKEKGLYALRDWIFERLAGRYSSDPRILATGPAALSTDMGAIGSSPIQNGKMTPVDTWAGRGGMGSRMLQHHGVAGIIYGGSYIDEDLVNRRLADQYFLSRYQMKMAMKDREATVKYRYDPALETGGTFGVNYAKMGTRLLAFNYRSIEWPAEKRREVHERLVKGHYLRQFNEETIETKSFRHCGEPCLAVCKKMRGEYKKDYEPYQTLGPLSGIFDQRAAEKLNRHCDSLGFDTIQIGGVIAWLMDAVDAGLMKAEDLGLPEKPVFSPDGFDPVRDSMKNAEIGCRLADLVVDPQGRLPDFRKGAREAAKRLGGFRDPAILDRLMATASGDRGWMVPNQYWTPGVFSPMPVMGRYYQYYGDDFSPPRTLGRVNADRMVNELVLDNTGFCRFHREWAEELAGVIFNDYFGLQVDFREHHLTLAKRINSGNASVFWESRSVVTLVKTFLERKRVEGKDRPELSEWIRRFEENEWEAARDYWFEIRKGIDDVLNDRPGA